MPATVCTGRSDGAGGACRARAALVCLSRRRVALVFGFSEWFSSRVFLLIGAVSFERLDFFRTARDQTGKRQYRHPKVTPADFERVLAGVQAGLGLPILTSGPRSPNV